MNKKYFLGLGPIIITTTLVATIISCTERVPIISDEKTKGDSSDIVNNRKKDVLTKSEVVDWTNLTPSNPVASKTNSYTKLFQLTKAESIQKKPWIALKPSTPDTSKSNKTNLIKLSKSKKNQKVPLTTLNVMPETVDKLFKVYQMPKTKKEIQEEDDQLIKKYSKIYNLKIAFGYWNDISYGDLSTNDGIWIDQKNNTKIDNNKVLIGLMGGPHFDGGISIKIPFFRFRDMKKNNIQGGNASQLASSFPKAIPMVESQYVTMPDFDKKIYSFKELKEIQLLNIVLLHKIIKLFHEQHKKVYLAGISYGGELLLNYLARYGSDADHNFIFSPVLFQLTYNDFYSFKLNSNHINELTYEEANLMRLQRVTTQSFNMKSFMQKKLKNVSIILGEKDEFYIETKMQFRNMPLNIDLYDNFFYKSIVSHENIKVYIIKNSTHDLVYTIWKGYVENGLKRFNMKLPYGLELVDHDFINQFLFAFFQKLDLSILNDVLTNNFPKRNSYKYL